jgi:hypothetical protein
VLNETADQIANIIRRGGGIYLKGTISEALSNGKSKLTQYYIAFALKFSFMTMMAIGVILFTFLPAILDLFLISGGLENWTLMIAFITPNIISSTTEQVYSTSTDVILGGKRPGFHSIMEIAKTITQFGWDYLLLFVLKWPQKVPILILIWIVALRDFPNKVLALIVNYIFINKKLVRLKIRTFAWQTWIAPIPAAVTVWIMAILWFNIAYSFLIKNTNIYVAGGITVTFGFLCLLWVFFPLYTLFGGWDDYGIKIFTDAVEISGPSKFLFRPIVFANKLLRKSPLHNRFTIPWQDADREAEELMKERFVKQKINEYLLSISI